MFDKRFRQQNNLICVGQQGFIQGIFMSRRRYRKLNLLIEFSNSIFIKFYFKAYWRWTFIQNKLAYCFFYFELFVCPSDVKRSKFFTSWIFIRALPWTSCGGYSTLTPLTCNLQHSKIQSLFKNGHLRNSLDKCLVSHLNC